MGCSSAWIHVVHFPNALVLLYVRLLQSSQAWTSKASHAYCQLLAIEIKQHLGQYRCIPFLTANRRRLSDSGVCFLWRYNSPFARSFNDHTRGADDCHGRRIIYVPNSVRCWIQWLKCWTVKRVSSPAGSFRCILAGSDRLFAAFWIAPLATAFVIFTLTLWKTHQYSRRNVKTL